MSERSYADVIDGRHVPELPEESNAKLLRFQRGTGGGGGSGPRMATVAPGGTWASTQRWDEDR